MKNERGASGTVISNPTRKVTMRLALGLLIIFGAACSTGAPPVRSIPTPDAAAAAGSVECEPVLDAPTGGHAALNALGSETASVAAMNDLTERQLSTLLVKDETFNLDTCGHALYVDAEGPAKSVRSVTSSLGGAKNGLAFPSAQTFSLHSLAGASRTLYLDFDGQAISGTVWNDDWNGGGNFNAPAYDTDGSAANFNETERDVVQSVWQRVSEDYAPFAIDVTTQDPGFDAINRANAGDTMYGTRIMITNDTLIYNQCSCGGVAYVGVTALTAPNHAYYQPGFVFANHGVTGAKNIAEATSHEAGHNFGLHHDGTSSASYYQGDGAWAPIMGVGYSRPIVQWSKGEYANANNNENDFAVMGTNGATPKTDDHGDSAAAATPMSGAASGEITTAADTDWFSFDGNGATTITLAVAPVSPDLDAKITLQDASGATIATADPNSSMTSGDVAAGLGATISTSLAGGGPFTIKVEGVGRTGNYSDFGSVGRYTLTVAAGGGAGAPTVTSMTPNNGPVGTSVTITGTGLTGASTVTFNGMSAPFTPNNATTVTATVPAGATTGPVAVTTAAGTGTSATSFAVTAGATCVAPNGYALVMGTANGETLVGSAGKDYICGLGGNDIVKAGGGADTIFGGDGNDTLNGQGGNDSFAGGAGTDKCNQGTFTGSKPPYPADCEKQV